MPHLVKPLFKIKEMKKSLTTGTIVAKRALAKFILKFVYGELKMDSMANTLNAIRQQANQSTQPINNKLLADCLFRDLRQQGLKDKDIVSLSSELIAQLTNDIKVRAEKIHAGEQPTPSAEKLTRTR